MARSLHPLSALIAPPILLVLAGPAASQALRVDRTVEVGPVPGNPLASGSRLLARLDRIDDASAAIPYLLKVEAGVYDLGGRSLAMKPFVDIEGSGEGVTRIRSAVDSAGTVVGADDAELRQLTVENEAATNAVALRSAAPRFALSQVTCLAHGGSGSSTAVLNDATGGRYRDLTARAEGSPHAIALYSRGGVLTRVRAHASASDLAYAVFNAVSDGELLDVTAEAVSGRFAGGIRNEGGAPLLRSVRASAQGADISDGMVNGNGTAARIFGAVIHAAGGASFAHGIRNENSSATVDGADIMVEAPSSAFGVASFFGGMPALRNATIRVSAGGNGIGVLSDGAQVLVDRSTIAGDGFSLANAFGTPGSAIGAGASHLGGPVRAADGTLRCAASYDSSLTPLDGACAPAP